MLDKQCIDPDVLLISARFVKNLSPNASLRTARYLHKFCAHFGFTKSGSINRPSSAKKNGVGFLVLKPVYPWDDYCGRSKLMAERRIAARHLRTLVR